MLTKEIKNKIVDKLLEQRKIYSTDTQHSTVLGINKAQYSRIKKGELDNVISEAKWVTLARLVDVSLNNKKHWIVVKTETFNYITTQLEVCQNRSMSANFCDDSSIGKTTAAVYYASHNSNAVYIDCSQVKSKQKLIREIARQFGVNNTGRYADVYADLVFYVKTLPNPLIILDEAGDLDPRADLELKALWNALPYSCGWYKMGADGFKNKWKRHIAQKKVGYVETLDRYGNDFKKVTPDGNEAKKEFHLRQIAAIAKANKAIKTPLELYAISKGSLRKVRHEIEKQALV